jgi:hypothetical protein
MRYTSKVRRRNPESSNVPRAATVAKRPVEAPPGGSLSAAAEAITAHLAGCIDP